MITLPDMEIMLLPVNVVAGKFFGMKVLLPENRFFHPPRNAKETLKIHTGKPISSQGNQITLPANR